MPGRHNALNATAAIAVAHELKAPVGDDPQGDRLVRRRQAPLHPHRRMERRRRSSTITATIPVEIAAVLRAARAATKGQVIAVVQPHRYTRLQSLFDSFAFCFNDADTVIVADVYPAGEAPIAGVDKEALAAAINAHGHRHAIALPSPDKLAAIVHEIAKPGRLSSSASAPAASPNGPMRCPANWRRWTARRHERGATSPPRSPRGRRPCAAV